MISDNRGFYRVLPSFFWSTDSSSVVQQQQQQQRRRRRRYANEEGRHDDDDGDDVMQMRVATTTTATTICKWGSPRPSEELRPPKSDPMQMEMKWNEMKWNEILKVRKTNTNRGRDIEHIDIGQGWMRRKSALIWVVPRSYRVLISFHFWRCLNWNRFDSTCAVLISFLSPTIDDGLWNLVVFFNVFTEFFFVCVDGYRIWWVYLFIFFYLVLPCFTGFYLVLLGVI